MKESDKEKELNELLKKQYKEDESDSKMDMADIVFYIVISAIVILFVICVIGSWHSLLDIIR